MAKIEDVPGVFVEVTVDDVALQEYDDDGDVEHKTVNKYIQATSGAAFKVQYWFDNTFNRDDGICLRIYVDGQYAESAVYKRSRIPWNYSTRRSIAGRRRKVDSHWVVEEFTFSGLAIDDNAGKSLQAAIIARIASLGVISVTVSRVKISKSESRAPLHKQEIAAVGALSEKSLKGRALTHSVQLAEPKFIPKVGISHVENLDNSPLATFNFKYRSLEALKNLYVIPRSPSPIPLEDRPPEELTREELLELLQKQRLKRTEERKVKMEGMRAAKRERDSDDDDEPSVVEARSRKAARHSESGNVAVVDLT